MIVKELRKALEGKPDDMPVMYQRIEDTYFDQHGWVGYSLIWEQRPGLEPHLSSYISAWDAYTTKSVDGETEAFVINAHY